MGHNGSLETAESIARQIDGSWRGEGVNPTRTQRKIITDDKEFDWQTIYDSVKALISLSALSVIPNWSSETKV